MATSAPTASAAAAQPASIAPANIKAPAHLSFRLDNLRLAGEQVIISLLVSDMSDLHQNSQTQARQAIYRAARELFNESSEIGEALEASAKQAAADKQLRAAERALAQAKIALEAATDSPTADLQQIPALQKAMQEAAATLAQVQAGWRAVTQKCESLINLGREGSLCWVDDAEITQQLDSAARYSMGQLAALVRDDLSKILVDWAMWRLAASFIREKHFAWNRSIFAELFQEAEEGRRQPKK